MKIITINGYKLATFIVESSVMHITVSNKNGIMTIRDFNNEKYALLEIINQFTKAFGKLPEEWNERVTKKVMDRTKNQIILILK